MAENVPGELDAGIAGAVLRLLASGIETFESCEGGMGHAYTEPTVRFYGTPEAGWRALSVCLAYGLPVACLRRIWCVLDHHEVTGPHWELTFSRYVPVGEVSLESTPPHVESELVLEARAKGCPAQGIKQEPKA